MNKIEKILSTIVLVLIAILFVVALIGVFLGFQDVTIGCFVSITTLIVVFLIGFKYKKYLGKLKINPFLLVGFKNLSYLCSI